MSENNRKEELFRVAVSLAKEIGYRAINRRLIGDAAGVAPTLIPYHLGAMDVLRKNILDHACTNGDVKLIVEGVLDNDKLAKKAALVHRNAIVKLLFGDK